MTEFDSNKCINKQLQGCTYTAGKCPYKLKKTKSEEEYEQRERYIHNHWKSVVLCKECIHRPILKGKHESIQPPIRNGKFDEKCPYICSDWHYSRFPYGDDFCSLGESNDKKRS